VGAKADGLKNSPPRQNGGKNILFEILPAKGAGFYWQGMDGKVNQLYPLALYHQPLKHNKNTAE